MFRKKSGWYSVMHTNSSFLPTSCTVGVGRKWRLRWYREKINASAKLLRNIRGRCRRANRDPGVGDYVSKVKEHTAHSRRK